MSENNGQLLDSLLKKADRKTVSVTLPGRGTFNLRSLYETEKINLYENWFYNRKTEVIDSRKKYLRVKMISLCAFEEDPETPIFPDGSENALLENWSASEVAEVYGKCSELNSENEDELLAELKNSESQQGDGSTSG